MTTQQAIAAISQDLYRVANGYFKGSDKMASVFLDSATLTRKQLIKDKIPTYIQTILEKFTENNQVLTREHIAENFLLWSLLLQNYAKKINTPDSDSAIH